MTTEEQKPLEQSAQTSQKFLEMPSRISKNGHFEFANPVSVTIPLPSDIIGEDQARLLLSKASLEFPEALILIQNSGIATSNASGEITWHVKNVCDWLFGHTSWLGHLDVQKQPDGSYKFFWPNESPQEIHDLMRKLAEKFQQV